MDKGPGKKQIEPTFTKGYTHIPRLREKLNWLYGHHPFIKTQEKLAKELHVSPATLSTWLNGTRYTDTKTVATSNPDSIPTKHYRGFLDLWGLPAAVLEIDDIGEFRNALGTFEAGRSPWEKLIRALPDDETIEIIANAERGIIDPDEEDEKGIVHLRANDEIMLRIVNPGLRYGVLLSQDRNGWSTLLPNSRQTNASVDSALIFPRQNERSQTRYAALDGILGVHRIVAIFTSEPLPSGVMDILLGRPMDLGGLNHTVSVFQSRLAAGPKDCRMFSRRFLVSGGSKRRTQMIPRSDGD